MPSYCFRSYRFSLKTSAFASQASVGQDITLHACYVPLYLCYFETAKKTLASLCFLFNNEGFQLQYRSFTCQTSKIFLVPFLLPCRENEEKDHHHHTQKKDRVHSIHIFGCVYIYLHTHTHKQVFVSSREKVGTEKRVITSGSSIRARSYRCLFFFFLPFLF